MEQSRDVFHHELGHLMGMTFGDTCPDAVQITDDDGGGLCSPIWLDGRRHVQTLYSVLSGPCFTAILDSRLDLDPADLLADPALVRHETLKIGTPRLDFEALDRLDLPKDQVDAATRAFLLLAIWIEGSGALVPIDALYRTEPRVVFNSRRLWHSMLPDWRQIEELVRHPHIFLPDGGSLPNLIELARTLPAPDLIGAYMAQEVAA